MPIIGKAILQRLCIFNETPLSPPMFRPLERNAESANASQLLLSVTGDVPRPPISLVRFRRLPDDVIFEICAGERIDVSKRRVSIEPILGPK